MAIILGIDPGSRVTGYGVIRQQGTASAVYRQRLYPARRWMISPSRLGKIYAGVSEIIRRYQPQLFAIEQVFMAKNADSALETGTGRGMAILAAVNNNLPVFEYAARRVKQTVTGTGRRKKPVQHMVRSMLKNCQRHRGQMRQMRTGDCYHSLPFHPDTDLQMGQPRLGDGTRTAEK